MVFEGKFIHVSVNPYVASVKTRRVIKKAGPFFELLKIGNYLTSRKDFVLLKSTKTGWNGWLHTNEITIKEETKD